MQNFCIKLPTHGTPLGFTLPQIAAANADCNMLIYLLQTFVNVMKHDAAEAVKYKDVIKNGPIGTPSGGPPAASAMPVAPATVAAGVLPRLRLDLGILAATPVLSMAPRSSPPPAPTPPASPSPPEPTARAQQNPTHRPPGRQPPLPRPAFSCPQGPHPAAHLNSTPMFSLFKKKPAAPGASPSQQPEPARRAAIRLQSDTKSRPASDSSPISLFAHRCDGGDTTLHS